MSHFRYILAKQYGFYVDTAKCTGCNTCRIACKDFYDLELGVSHRRVYEYEGGNWVKKDNGCFERTPMGRQPIGVEACPMRALDFNQIEILREKYGHQANITSLSSSEKTQPSLVIRSNRFARPAGDTTGNLQNAKKV